MAAGDHLVISYGLFTHHAIDLGDGNVVQVSKAARKVQRVSFEVFCDGREVWIREYDQSHSAIITVALALTCVGDNGYNLVFNNCEHFATWCKTGRWESAQVRCAQRQLIAAGTKGATKATVKVLAKGSSKLAAKAIARVATPWLFVADAVQLGTEVAVSNSGADPDKAEMIGRGAGLVASVGIGGAVGGPVGAGVGFGLWLFGEMVGAIFSR